MDSCAPSIPCVLNTCIWEIVLTNHARVHVKGQAFGKCLQESTGIIGIPLSRRDISPHRAEVWHRWRSSTSVAATGTIAENKMRIHDAMLRKMTAVLSYCAGTVLLFFAFLCLRVLRLLPWGKSTWAKLWKIATTIDLPMEDYWNSLFTWHMFQSVRSTILYELQKSARLGQRAPNPSVVTLDGTSHPHLLNFCRGNRPLVLNFGSWSCPVFRARTEEFLNIVRQFRDVVDFLTVYIEEAHPSNGWAFENNVVIPAHETLEQRCQAARLMLSSVKFDCPVVVDTMDDETSKAYGGLPIRLYIIKNNKVELAGAMGPTFYAPKEVEQWLKDYRAEIVRSGRHRA